MDGRTRLRPLLLVATVVTLLGSTTVGVGATAAQAAAPPGPTGPLDHVLCYASAAASSTVVPGFAPPSSVLLANQFNPNGFKAKLKVFTTHCNPVQKTLPTGEVFKIQNPSWHLGCWSIKPDATAKIFRVQVTNQFGTGVLRTTAPTQLCLPSLKSESSPPSFTGPGPNEVQPDHVTCYPVVYVKGAQKFTPPPFVRLNDQFTPAGASFTTKIGAPTQLCLPTAKTVPGQQPTPVRNPREHLLCFALNGTNPAALPRTVFDRNQFGVGAVRVTADNQRLCLPSLKEIIG